ncbi:unnamed protein product [Colias eurytheme]|nr:unnamed protein product [Colias eurytheme]
MGGEPGVDPGRESPRHLRGVRCALLVQAEPLEQAVRRRLVSHAHNETEKAVHLFSIITIERLGEINETEMSKPLLRVRRSSDGAGKFAQAAKGSNIKSLRMFLQLFKNSWDSAYVGGSHPLHPNVPKAVVSLYKLRIVDYFFPHIGEDPRKNG